MMLFFHCFSWSVDGHKQDMSQEFQKIWALFMLDKFDSVKLEVTNAWILFFAGNEVYSTCTCHLACLDSSS